MKTINYVRRSDQVKNINPVWHRPDIVINPVRRRDKLMVTNMKNPVCYTQHRPGDDNKYCTVHKIEDNNVFCETHLIVV